ncbi:uncharacterized protein N0V89_001097 [Didymosphaeria variabile]|uniref:Indole-diterpene biosynthesis protein-like protein PaxU n=1 Tax=Didymosphaeria variabile TaxID=1932322 RepID=A0A9W8XVH5_9PLEO|nr:uncharacterized protein N0V89_001097 [Didymosphaeria variabile]KAJ4360532.1 hypothetical protein N0V89_001097 [Didymosphaeria variabile]
MSKSQHNAIPGFTLIAPTIWEQQPAGRVLSFSVHRVLSEEPPSLIIILPWTGAHSRHVVKYTEAYGALFPSAPILCITTSTKDICLRSSKRKQQRLQPAVERILDHVKYNDGRANILLHAFSEGGSNKAVELAEAYCDTTGMKLPCSALCLDSTPGHPRYLRLCNALKKSLPPIPILNCTGLLVGSTLLGGIWILYKFIKGYENNVISSTRRRLQDSNRWDVTAPRCYFYSKGDELIAWKDIREHLGEAVRSGAPVMDVCFQDSAHCKHAAQYPDRYWGAVALTWKRTCINNEKRDTKLHLKSGFERTRGNSGTTVSVVRAKDVQP